MNRLYWSPDREAACFSPTELRTAAHRFREAAYVVKRNVQPSLKETMGVEIGIGLGGSILLSNQTEEEGLEILAQLSCVYPEWLGSRGFTECLGLRFPYVSGAMANGIATVEIVEEMARIGCMGFFGAAGLSLERVEQAIQRLSSLTDKNMPWGSNLIHSPNEPELEEAVCDLYLKYRTRCVSAAAYMKLTPAVVRYAVSGLQVDSDGLIQRQNHLFAKISRPEVARHFMSPAPVSILDHLLRKGQITQTEHRLAQHVPVASSFTVESDSGGHTDNQPLGALFSSIQMLRNEILERYNYQEPIYLGAAGGIGTPQAVASAFALGASYVVTGSINQAAVESGLDASGKKLLAQAGLADVVMAPAADMFELGVEVQVLRRGTMFGTRAKKLYEIYRRYDSLDTISDKDRIQLERDFFRKSLADAWNETASYWAQRDPRELDRAKQDEQHKMALLFRSYLGQSSKWAIAGVSDRKLDYQIWCGPAMGAFNDWAKGSFLEDPSNRSVSQIALNLLEGAAVLNRAQQMRSNGVPLPDNAFVYRPRPIVL
ncbi:MAG: 2-nitropropane dioxygenase [Proteobacteria bacterium]|nr:2-nitropropane dioxygenase [Pseudomonadota bacterium]